MTQTPPLKSQRQQCWAARDAYFSCLDSHGLWLHGLRIDKHEDIVALDIANPRQKRENDPSLAPAEKEHLFACKKSLAEFDNKCLASWVFHFSMLRLKELQTASLVNIQLAREKNLRSDPDSFWDKINTK